MDEFSIARLEAMLATKTLGRRAVFLKSVDSTNSEARRLIARGMGEGLAVIAEEQTAGRGRRGRQWVSGIGCGLWMSAVALPQIPMEELQKTTVLAALAVARAVEEVTQGAVRPAIKWPNDLLVQGRKLCGILCETAASEDGAQFVIIGIGVNTKIPAWGWSEALGIAISLEEACGAATERLTLAARILNNLEALLQVWQDGGFGRIAEGYRAYMLPPGSAVTVLEGETGRQGIIDGLDDGGGLRVKLANGEILRIISGEISVRGV